MFDSELQETADQNLWSCIKLQCIYGKMANMRVKREGRMNHGGHENKYLRISEIQQRTHFAIGGQFICVTVSSCSNIG